MTSGMQADGDLELVAKAVVARFGEVSIVGGGTLPPVEELEHFELFWYAPGTHDVPALLIRPDPTKDRDYQGTMRGYTKYHLRLELHVDATDDQAASSELGRLVSKRGPIITRLADDEIRDDLWDLCGMDMSLTDGRGWKRNKRGRLQADIGLQVGAN